MSGTPHVVLDNTFGAMFIGVLIGAALFGVSCLQIWHYFARFYTDPWYFKTLVAVVGISDAVHQALISHTMYIYLVRHFANLEYLNTIVSTLVVEVLFEGFTALFTQMFFCYRIYRLSHKNIPLTAFVMALCFGNFAVLAVYTGKAFQLHHVSALPQIKAWALALNAMAAVTDIVIAAIMCSLLHVARSGFKPSDNVINKLILFVVNTGLLTSFCALASLITNIVWSHALIYICFFFIIGRLYTNSLLAALNSRSGGTLSREDASTSNAVITELDQVSGQGRRMSVPLTNMSVASNFGTRSQQHITIKIDQTAETHDDDDVSLARRQVEVVC